MKSLSKRFFLILLINILAVTSFVSCSLLRTDEREEYEDPVAKAALLLRPGAFPMSPEGQMRAQQELQQIETAANSGEVVLGMKMDDVLNAWGEPANVQTAGDPRFENQRWTYYHGLIGRNAMSNSARIVYFEAGRVVGWQMR